MRKYIGTYRVFPEVDLITGKPVDDLYLKGRYDVRVSGYSKDEMSILFLFNQTVNKLLPELKKLKIELYKLSEGDSESIYVFKEKDLDKVAPVLKLQIRGKNIDPMSSKNRLPKEKRIAI